ncbi:uncharacterized protein LOC123269368 [Cotesia glomerata]|uniref:Uncharacterized protein n=1 Tax=Cotesia glomerata TaxID=32391 RepID=A0AAV7HPY4_COTGL|nr:uncharacterized protein LOC123269368 [Cotesia glomerata]KAH0546207.1 hypothetical protein KQX54_007160 [Cotesia glomerata]
MSKKAPAAKKQKTENEPKKSRIVRSTSERIENYLKNNVGRKCWEKYLHNTIPGLNLNKKPWVQQWDFENAVNLYRRYPYTCDLPKPLLPPARIRRHIHNQHDPATDLLFAKQFIQDDMDLILDHFENDIEGHNVLSNKDVKWSGTKYDRGHAVVPRYVADLADIIECDPDPFFEGKYNWYYTGGSINNIYFNNKNLLIFPFMEDVVASPINLKDNSLWKPDLSKASKSTIGNPVYEVRHYVSPDNCRILVRCKHECVFYSLTSNDEGKLSLEALDNKENKSTPFISAALNPVDPNQFCTLNVGRIFEQCDMVSGKCLSKSLLNTEKSVPDNWGSIRYNSSPNIVALTDRNALHYMDLRVSLRVPTVSMCPQEMLNDCDLVSLHMPSERPSRHYLGTYHHFLMVDDRSPDQCVHQKWTHQFRSPPLTGATCMCDGEEVIIISSQLPSEKSVIVNTWQQFDDPHSYYLPHAVPTILETLKESQLLGTCLDPITSTRVGLSTVGSTLMVHDKNIYYFNQNSLEDVFYSCITHNELEKNISLINDYAGHALKCWEQEMLKNQEKLLIPLAITDRFNMEHIFKQFSDTTLKYELNEEENFMPEYWRQPVYKLREYKDLLAPLLLEPWDLECDLGDYVPDEPKEDPKQRWLDDWVQSTTSSQAVPPLEENLPMSQVLDDDHDHIPFTPVLTQDLVSVSQQHMQPNPEIQVPIIKTEPADLAEELDDFMTITKVVKPKKPKKQPTSTYTDGF